jgi:hypothetical protein
MPLGRKIHRGRRANCRRRLAYSRRQLFTIWAFLPLRAVSLMLAPWDRSWARTGCGCLGPLPCAVLGLPCSAGMHKGPFTGVLCLEKAACAIDHESQVRCTKRQRGWYRGVDLTLSQPRLPNLLDRVVGVTTESGAVSCLLQNVAANRPPG